MVKLNRLGLFESRRDFIHCSSESDGLRQLENLVPLGTLSYRIVSYPMSLSVYRVWGIPTSRLLPPR